MGIIKTNRDRGRIVLAGILALAMMLVMLPSGALATTYNAPTPDVVTDQAVAVLPDQAISLPEVAVPSESFSAAAVAAPEDSPQLWESADIICYIGTTGYDDLGAALFAAREGQTIRLVASIDYYSNIVITSRSITIDVGSYVLNVRPSEGNAVDVANGDLFLQHSGGELNAFGANSSSTAGAVAHDANSSVTVTNAIGSYYGIVAESGSVTALGDVEVYNLFSGDASIGAFALSGGSAIVNGRASGAYCGAYADAGSVLVRGTAIAYNDGPDAMGIAAFAKSGGDVEVGGDLVGRHSGAYTDNGSIRVGGNVTARTVSSNIGGNGVYCLSGSVSVIGTIVATYTGVYAPRGNVSVYGDIRTETNDEARGIGVYTLGGGEICVAGNVSGAYIAVAADGGIISVGGYVLGESTRPAPHGFGVYALGGGQVTVNSAVVGSYIGVRAGEPGTSVQVNGNVIGVLFGVLADDLSTIVVNGNVSSKQNAGLQASSGGSITVVGDVDSLEDAVVCLAGTITVLGSVSGDTGVFAESANAVVSISGDIAASAYGVYANRGAQVTIGGNINMTSDGFYIVVDTMIKEQNQNAASSSKPGYLEYSNSGSFVWVRAAATAGAPRSGDYDGDGNVTLSEALIVARVVVGSITNLTAEQFAAVDMDGDGYITMTDVLLVMRKALGL